MAFSLKVLLSRLKINLPYLVSLEKCLKLGAGVTVVMTRLPPPFFQLLPELYKAFAVVHDGYHILGEHGDLEQNDLKKSFD
jgi:hypothetical protein